MAFDDPTLDRFGYDIGVISSCFTMPDFIERFGEQRADGTHYLDANRQSIITSLLGAGTFVGSIAQVRAGGVWVVSGTTFAKRSSSLLYV